MQKKVKSFIESLNKLMKRSHQSQQQNGSKRWWGSEDLQNTNLSTCESKKGEKFVG